MQSVPQQESVLDIELSNISLAETQEVSVPEATNAYFHLRMIEQCMQWMSENASKPNIWKAIGALVIIGIVIVSATGPTTCSTFNVTNDLDDTLYISQLSPYSAKYATNYNHPVWSPKSYLSTGVVEISKGYTSEVKMRVDKYYTLGDDYFYLHMNTNGHSEDFYVTGRDDLQLKPTLGFFSCNVKLQSIKTDSSNSTESKFLRG